METTSPSKFDFPNRVYDFNQSIDNNNQKTG